MTDQPMTHEQAVTELRGGFSHWQCPDHCRECNAARVLAEQYLRESDPTPITPEWLRECGLEVTGWDRGGYATYTTAEFELGIWSIGVCWLREDESSRNLTWPVPITTRGSLRSLCRVLGSPLKEEVQS